jgi:hypothetical protein
MIINRTLKHGDDCHRPSEETILIMDYSDKLFFFMNSRDRRTLPQLACRLLVRALESLPERGRISKRTEDTLVSRAMRISVDLIDQ